MLSKIGALQSILSGGTNWATLDDTRKMAAKQAAEKLISEHLVAVFSKSYCPYCTQAKSVIAKLGLDQSSVGVLELDQMGSEGSDIQVSCAHTMKEKKRKEMRLIELLWSGLSDGEDEPAYGAQHLYQQEAPRWLQRSARRPEERKTSAAPQVDPLLPPRCEDAR